MKITLLMLVSAMGSLAANCPEDERGIEVQLFHHELPAKPLPRNASLFVRVVRPVVRTVHTVTDILGFPLGTAALLAGVNSIINYGKQDTQEVNLCLGLVAFWGGNKLLNILSRNIYEEMTY